MRREFFKMIIRDVIIISLFGFLILLHGPVSLTGLGALAFGWLGGALLFEFAFRPAISKQLDGIEYS